MKTSYFDASWLSLVETPHGIALQIFEDGNDTRVANAVLFMTPRQWAGAKKQIPIKLKKQNKKTKAP